mgnify:CR=1 FL=1
MEIKLDIEDISVGIVDSCRKIGILDHELVNENSNMISLAIGERRSTDWTDEEVISHMLSSITDIREMNGTLKGISASTTDTDADPYFNIFLNGKEILSTCYLTKSWFMDYWGMDSYERCGNRVYATWEKELEENPRIIADILKNLTSDKVKKHGLEKLVKEVDSYCTMYENWDDTSLFKEFIESIVNDYYIRNIPKYNGKPLVTDDDLNR